MLVIQPTADGRLRIYNNHRSDFARDETSARALAYNWGHTDISINKALSEMRSAARGETEPSGWRVARPEPKRAAPEPAPRVEMGAPVPERRARAKKGGAPKPPPNTVLAPTRAVAPAPAAAPAKPRAKTAPVAKAPRKVPADTEPKRSPNAPVKAVAKVPAKAAAKTPAKAVAKVPAKAAAKTPAKAVAKVPAKADPPGKAPSKPSAAAPRERALAMFRSGVKELAGMEEATLAFARGPWSELREMAEYITACLEGKRPKTGWERK